MCDEFAELREALETACQIFPDSILPIAHYWQNRGVISIFRAHRNLLR